MRTFITLATAAFALTSTSALARDGQQRFTHQGSTYLFTTAEQNGRTVISGQQLPSGETFRLVVDGGHVSGVSGGQPVAFRTATALGAAGSVQIAAN